MTALRARWHNILHGFWFVPGMIVVAMALGALLLVRLDRALATSDVGALYSGDASAAQGILSTIAAATATIAGVVFSITIVTLQLVSSQFTPRALRGFLKDRLNQATAGVFVGTFVYSLLVLRTIRAADEQGGGEFVPALAMTTATVLGLTSLLVLIVFIHHVADSIQASTIAEKLGRATMATIDRLYPEPYGEPEEEEGEAEELLHSWRDDAFELHAPRAGYVQSIALDELVDGVGEPGARIHVAAQPGDFVTPADVLARVWGTSASEEGLEECGARTITVFGQRDMRDDVGFGLRQLSDIAVRALSPGMNDPTTARTCLGYVRGALEELAARRDPPAVRRFDDVLAVVERPSFKELLENALSEIAHHGAREPSVAHQLLTALRSIARAAGEARAWARLDCVVDLADTIGARLVSEAETDEDRARLERELAAVREVAREAVLTQDDSRRASGASVELVDPSGR